MAESKNRTAKVDGVLIGNDATRKEQLKRIYWKDKQYTDFANGDFVRNIEVTDREVEPVTEGKDLLNYTFDNKSEYSSDILSRNFGNGVNHRVYENEIIPKGNLWKWEGDYFEGYDWWDASIYKIGQIKLAEGEMRNKEANDSRFLENKYLTPQIANFYGDKVNSQMGIMQYTLQNRMDGIINAGTGRMADIPEAEVGFEHDIYDVLTDSHSFDGDGRGTLMPLNRVDGNFRFLYKNIINAQQERNNASAGKPEKHWKLPTERYMYVGEDIDGDNIDSDVRAFKNDISTNGITQETYGKNVQVVYSEGDIKNQYDRTIFFDSQNANGKTYLDSIALNKGLLSKTDRLFINHKISTLSGRFHTTINENGLTSDIETTDSAKSRYGNSHGRNLLKKGHEGGNNNVNGYDNPYCRVWTYHHQYDTVNKLIRHSSTDFVKGKRPYVSLPASDSVSLSGEEYLKKHTVLSDTGFVNIAPKGNGNCSGSSVEIKKCMFSIENLAWKDVPRKEAYISEEQRGPNGGRIMWFPPYDLDFQESVNVRWNESNFIGRGEPVYTYQNTDRSGTLSFVILVDHPSFIDNIPKNNIKTNSPDFTEEDILRFFAGCGDVPAIPEAGKCEEEKEEEDKPDGIKHPTPRLSEEGKTVKFYVYFPNNYSGNMTSKVESEEEFLKSGTADYDWFDYLLFGRNAILPENENGSGFGMSKEFGITTVGMPKDEAITDVYTLNDSWKKSGTVPGTKRNKEVAYYYRVDYDIHQNLVNEDENGKPRGMAYNKSNYVDRQDGKGFNGNFKKMEEGATNSFIYILYALFEANKNNLKDNGIFAQRKQIYEEEIKGRTAEEETVSWDELVTLFRQDRGKVKIEIHGNATSQDSEKSQVLAMRRNHALKDLLKNYFNDNGIYVITTGVTGELKNSKTINSTEAKQGRYSCVTITYSVPEITYSTADEEKTAAVPQRNASSDSDTVAKSKTTEKTVKTGRYETEAEYFNNLQQESPLTYKNLIDKFKYFSPAYHSISPEGFNARLTFLQQCTRQGHTIEASNVAFAKTAGNLSFGRMPVCVLRLGDFLNTKIIINGMSITFGADGNMRWDLNPEGIGVQPMYAKVQLQIKILGGQSLEGPISRLQNAVSFNYYANTGVYDNRSDRISISDGTTNGERRLIRTEIKENNGEKYSQNTYDGSQYDDTRVTYQYLFTPSPDIEVEKEKINENKKAK